MINVISNWDNIGDFWQGLAVFGAGAGAGGLSMLSPLGAMGGGLLAGTVNSSIQDVSSHGHGHGNVQESVEEWVLFPVLLEDKQENWL